VAAFHFYPNSSSVQAGATVILLALGANIPSMVGEPYVTLTSALDAMTAQNIRVVKVSPFYTTPAWPDPKDPAFLNAVASVETTLDPSALLTILHDIEAQFGRQRLASNAPRSLDIDLLDFHGMRQTDWPILPHPRMRERAFVLVPLAEVAPDWCHPETGERLVDLLDALPLSDRRSVVPLGR